MKVRWHTIYVKDHVYAEKNEQIAICHIMWGGKVCGSVSDIGDQTDRKNKIIQHYWHCTLICHDKALNVIDRWICYILKDIIDLYFISSDKLFFSTKTDTSKVGLLQESPATCFKGPSLKINIPLFITNCNVRVGNSRLFFFAILGRVPWNEKKWKRC